MTRKTRCIFALGVLTLLAGCKTNEKNYRAAYDAALSKRVAADADAAVLSDGHAVQSIDGPSKVKIDEGEVYLERQRLKPDDAVPSGEGQTSVVTHTGPFAVAVGVYRMPTNARSQVESLRDTRHWQSAYVAKSADGRVWSIIGAYATLQQAADAIAQFRKDYPQYSYVGLPGEPVVVEQ